VVAAVRFFRRISHVLWLSAAVALFAGLSPVDAGAAATVSNIRIGVHLDKLRVVLETDAKFPVSAFELSGPYRIVVDLPDVTWRIDSAGGERATRFISGYRFGQFVPGKSRLVFDLKRPALVDKAFHIPPTGGRPWRLVIDIKSVAGAVFAARAAKPPPAPEQSSGARAAVFVPPPRPKPEGAQRKRVVVLEPGPGGIDPGALARGRSVREKDITLAMARQLRDELIRRGRYHVVLTRDRDIFIRLRERIGMARAAGADVFISLHADFIRNRKVRGASVYTLSERASDREAADLAAKENKSDVIAGVDLTGETAEVTNILIDLAQRETMNHSAAFARILVREMSRNTKFLRKSHRFAGFAVLKAPDVPSVLVEMGYLSNSRDVSQLTSRSYRAGLAAAIADGVDGYFATLPDGR
jgi:N-acetylmuramoyl-L-alanine amidase